MLVSSEWHHIMQRRSANESLHFARRMADMPSDPAAEFVLSSLIAFTKSSLVNFMSVRLVFVCWWPSSVKNWIGSEICFVVSGWQKTLVYCLRRIWLLSLGVDDTFPPPLNSGPTLVLVLENFLQYLKKNLVFFYVAYCLILFFITLSFMR